MVDCGNCIVELVTCSQRIHVDQGEESNLRKSMRAPCPVPKDMPASRVDKKANLGLEHLQFCAKIPHLDDL